MATYLWDNRLASGSLYDRYFQSTRIGPARHEEVMNTIRLFGEQVIPHFQ